MWPMLRGYRARVTLSLLLVIAEAIGWVGVPFMIGLALEDYLSGSNRGLILFAGLGLVTVLLAVVRRLHDVRLYSRIYERAGTTASATKMGLSEKTARLNMLREVVDFLEYSMPELIGSSVAFVGTLVFLAALSVPVFVAALVMTALVVVIYAASSQRTLVLNRGYNDEYERQVDVLGRNDSTLTRRHIGLLNSWTIKLSDVDAVNYALSLSLAVALQLFAIVTSTRQGMDEGALLSVVLYVFEFSATISYLPVSWQEYLRLREILNRLGGVRGG
jgi:hypothetical protein